MQSTFKMEGSSHINNYTGLFRGRQAPKTKSLLYQSSMEKVEALLEFVSLVEY